MKHRYDNHWLNRLCWRLRRQPSPPPPEEIACGWEKLRERLLTEDQRSPWRLWWQRRSGLEWLLFLLFITATGIFGIATHLGEQERLGQVQRPLPILYTDPSLPSLAARKFTPKPAWTSISSPRRVNANSLFVDTTTVASRADTVSDVPAYALLEGQYQAWPSTAPQISPPVAVAAEQAQPSQRKRLRIDVGLAVAPIWHINQGSQASARIKSELGLEVGAAVHYRLHPRWELNSGLFILSQFSALRRPSPERLAARWSQDFIIDQRETTEGGLVILNIPLQVRHSYAFGKYNQKAFYVQGGVSNYLYLKELFSVNVERVFANQAAQGIEVRHHQHARTIERSGQMDFLSTLNVSTGLSWRLSSSACLQVEPFLHIPLQNLTSQQMRFYTTGTRLRLSWGKSPEK
ncbi:MAG: hypothetical protein ACFCUI_05150 [Bernardetiaceae bacterium]